MCAGWKALLPALPALRDDQRAVGRKGGKLLMDAARPKNGERLRSASMAQAEPGISHRLRKVSCSHAVLAVDAFPLHLQGEFGAQTLPVAFGSHQMDGQPMVAVSPVVAEENRAAVIGGED